MFSDLERKVLQGVSDTGFVLEPASSLDQESDRGSGLAIGNGCDLDAAGGVDDGSERACETCGVANGGRRWSQHWRGWREGMGEEGNGNRRVLVGGRSKPHSLTSVPALSDARPCNSSSSKTFAYPPHLLLPATFPMLP